MALPNIKTLEACSDFSKAVEPYIPQLLELPRHIVANLSSLDSLLKLYVDTNPLVSAVAISLVLGAIFLIASEVTRNFSQVDRFWSILPNLYVAHFAVWARLAGEPHARIDLILAFTTIWSARLTYNYWRKGGYSYGSEDYRWPIIRNAIPSWAFFIFNCTFISFMQSVLLMAFSSFPVYTILLASKLEEDITAADDAFFALELGLILSEWISDGQQWRYQNAKHKYQKDAKLPSDYKQVELDRGFIATGLWAYMRHPNFAAEQTIWFILYTWSCFATNVMYNWTFVGVGSLILLFMGSTWLTELITAGKYPEYAEYQKQVGCFFPMSLKPYETPFVMPKIIRTSELAKRAEEKKKTK